MSVKLLTEHHKEFLSVKGFFTGLSESSPVKMPHCWKSHVVAQMYMYYTVCVLFENEEEKRSQRHSNLGHCFFILFGNVVRA